MSPETYANPIASRLMGGVFGALGNLATLPQRAFQASETMRQGGDYDPGPVLEAATLPMGTGAIAGVPMRTGEMMLGAGPVRRLGSASIDAYKAGAAVKPISEMTDQELAAERAQLAAEDQARAQSFAARRAAANTPAAQRAAALRAKQIAEDEERMRLQDRNEDR